MRTFLLDIRHGLRLLAGHPAFTLVAVLTLALGIAATTTVFSWVDGILLHPFPGVEATHRLAAVESVVNGAPSGANRLSYPDYQDLQRNLKLVSGLAAHRDEVFSVGDLAGGQPVWGEAVSLNYFEVLGVRPSLGRAFTTRHCADAPGACPEIVVSHQFWRDRLGAQSSAIGRTLRVNRREFTLVGVAPPEFRGTATGLRYDLWAPLAMSAELGLGADTWTERGRRGIDILARLAPGVTIAQSRAEVAAFAQRLADTYPLTNRNIAATVVPLEEMRTGAAALLRAPLRILLAVSIVVLLIVCANLANLLLARSVSRTRELTVRIALGASRLRLALQILAEILPIAIAGALVGLTMAHWMADLLPLLVPRIGVPVAMGFSLSGPVLLFATIICVGAALLSALAPVMLSLRANVNSTLKDGGRGGTQGQSNRAQGLLVVSQVALAAVSLVGAGLFLRSFENARIIHPGFDRDNVLLARFYMTGSHYSPQQLDTFFQRLQGRVRTAPGVRNASYGDYAPLGSNAGPYTGIQVEGYAPTKDDPMMVSENLIAPGYLETLGIPLLEGRDFNVQDTPDRAPVLIVSQAFARKYYKAASPLGRRVRAWGKWRTIVGMARDSKHFAPNEPDLPYFYSPLIYSSNANISVYFLVRTAGDPHAAIPLLRSEAMNLDPESIAMQPMSLREWTDVTLFSQKVAAGLMAALGAISLLLAAVGLYSTMAYSVSQRTQEFGIRMALGATMSNVLSDVLAQGLRRTAAGLLVGLVGAALVTRVVQSMLVHVSAVDPLTFGAAACFLALVAVAACAIPGWQAARVDPMVALRQE